MANFGLGGSPAFSTFRGNFGLGQTAFSDIIARIWPNNDNQGYDISAMSSYRNQTLFRYNVSANGPGLIRVLYPFETGFTSSYLTPWFRVGNPPYITVNATANYPAQFRWWQDGNGTIISYSNPSNIAWNTTGTLDIVARFF